jgi:simple sugar transport system substrate-binding protein
VKRIPDSQSRRRALASIAAAAAVPAAATLPLGSQAIAQPKQPVAPPLKVGFVYVSPVSDAGWTHQHNNSRMDMEKALAGRVTTTFVEKITEGADAERVIRDLASQGHRLIFTTSFGFMEPTIKVAREFPDVAFEHATGYKSAPNVATYNARFYEGRYLAGMIAGRMTKSNTMGYVAAFPIPEVLQGINAFTMGARSVNPNYQTRVIWTNSWFDPGRERDAALTLIGQGADVLTHHTDSSAVAQAAEQRGAWVVSYHSNMNRMAPTRQLAAITHHWARYYEQRAQAVLEGKWSSGTVWNGIREGFIRVEPIADAVPADVRNQVKAREADIAAGRFHPFTGPIRDNEGKVRHERGAMTDAQLGEINWFAEGVIGKVPGK